VRWPAQNRAALGYKAEAPVQSPRLDFHATTLSLTRGAATQGRVITLGQGFNIANESIQRSTLHQRSRNPCFSATSAYGFTVRRKKVHSYAPILRSLSRYRSRVAIPNGLFVLNYGYSTHKPAYPARHSVHPSPKLVARVRIVMFPLQAGRLYRRADPALLSPYLARDIHMASRATMESSCKSDILTREPGLPSQVPLTGMRCEKSIIVKLQLALS
jgi:hypothetical protein